MKSALYMDKFVLYNINMICLSYFFKTFLKENVSLTSPPEHVNLTGNEKDHTSFEKFSLIFHFTTLNRFLNKQYFSYKPYYLIFNDKRIVIFLSIWYITGNKFPIRVAWENYFNYSWPSSLSTFFQSLFWLFKHYFSLFVSFYVEYPVLSQEKINGN